MRRGAVHRRHDDALRLTDHASRLQGGSQLVDLDAVGRVVLGELSRVRNLEPVNRGQMIDFGSLELGGVVYVRLQGGGEEALNDIAQALKLALGHTRAR